MLDRMMQCIEIHKMSHGTTARMLAAHFLHAGLVFDKKAIAVQVHKEHRRRWQALHPGEPMPQRPRYHPETALERFQPLPLKPVGHPFVAVLFQLMNHERISMRGVEDQAGLGRGTLGNWRGHQPKVGDLEAALNVVGYSLRPGKAKP